MKRALLTLGLALILPFASADAVSDFLKVRKTNKLNGVVGPSAINTLIGTKVFEIKANIKGIVRIGDDSAILLENVDGSSLTIRSKTLPAWLVEGGAQSVRFIVKASRPEEYAELQATLLAAIPEVSIQPHDVKARSSAPANTKSSASNDPNNPLYGSIGRRGSKIESRGGTASSRYPRGTVVSPEEAVAPYADFIQSRNRRMGREEAEKIATLVIKFSLDYNLDARLIMAMAMAESNFNPGATSHAGAQGLLQLMPGTAAGLGVRNSYDVTQNVLGAVKLMAGHLAKYEKQTGGDPEQTLILALAAYNAGGGAVKKHGGVPPYRETQNYVRKVKAVFDALRS